MVKQAQWSRERENKRSHKYCVMDVDVLEEPELDTEEHGTKRPHKEPVGSLSKTRQQSVISLSTGSSGTEPYGASYSGFPPVYPVFMSHNRWGERGGGEEDIQDNLLHSSCTAGGSIDQASPTSVIEYSVYLHDQHKIADCTRTRPVTPPVSAVTHRPCPFIPVPNSVTTIGTTVSPFVNPVISSTMTDTCSPFSSMSSTTGLAWDTLRSTSKSPGCSDRDPVSAAAHLHLLGESLSLIGRHLQETDKMVCMSSGLSLLLDSLLCALAPLICLTMQIPELRSCTQHTLASTLENIAYVMPGL